MDGTGSLREGIVSVGVAKNTAVDEMIRWHDRDAGGYENLWWLEYKGAHPFGKGLPSGTYAASGAGVHVVMVIDVEALEESALLLTISWRREKSDSAESFSSAQRHLDEQAVSRMDDEGGTHVATDSPAAAEQKAGPAIGLGVAIRSDGKIVAVGRSFAPDAPPLLSRAITPTAHSTRPLAPEEKRPPAS